MKATTYMSSHDLWKILHDAGLVPEKCRDIIIEAKVGEAVIIHFSAFADEEFPKVMQAFASAAKVVEE